MLLLLNYSVLKDSPPLTSNYKLKNLLLLLNEKWSTEVLCYGRYSERWHSASLRLNLVISHCDEWINTGLCLFYSQAHWDFTKLKTKSEQPMGFMRMQWHSFKAPPNPRSPPPLPFRHTHTHTPQPVRCSGIITALCRPAEFRVKTQDSIIERESKKAW